ncbi:MAG: PH domain-containing protein [Mycobacteriales bacterium]
MAYPRGLLSDGETVVLDLHPHWRALVLPLGRVPVTVGVAAFLIEIVPDWSVQRWLRLAVVVVALLLLLWFSLRPYLRWVTTHYVVTDRRIVLREGVVARNGRDVPLNRVNDVTFRHSVVERFFRSGTLIIESAGERGQVVLTDVPRVERVQRTVYDLVAATEQDGVARSEDGPPAYA